MNLPNYTTIAGFQVYHEGNHESIGNPHTQYIKYNTDINFDSNTKDQYYKVAEFIVNSKGGLIVNFTVSCLTDTASVYTQNFNLNLRPNKIAFYSDKMKDFVYVVSENYNDIVVKDMVKYTIVVKTLYNTASKYLITPTLQGAYWITDNNNLKWLSKPELYAFTNGTPSRLDCMDKEYRTQSTASYMGKYVRIASMKTTSQYQNQEILLEMFNTTYTPYYAKIKLSLNQIENLSSPPSANLRVLECNELFNYNDFTFIQVDSNTFELYFKIPVTYDYFIIKPISIFDSTNNYDSITLYNRQSFLDTLPNYASVVSNTINRSCNIYGTSLPTTGTWSVGNRVINSTPTVASPKSWVCTVSGTPGTWVSEGNL